MTAQERSNTQTIERMVSAYNAAVGQDLSAEEALARTLVVFDEFYAPDVRWTEAPTPFHPGGRTGSRAELRTAAERVSALVTHRRYTLVDTVAVGDRVAAEYVWEARFREGGRGLRIPLATFYRLRDGLVAELHEYPCVDTRASA